MFAVLGQMWVFASAALLLAQTHNTWRVYRGQRSSMAGLVIGLALVGINLAALCLAVLGQFWVIVSTGLACWQYVSLIRVCTQRWQGRVLVAAAASPFTPTAESAECGRRTS